MKTSKPSPPPWQPLKELRTFRGKKISDIYWVCPKNAGSSWLCSSFHATKKRIPSIPKLNKTHIFRSWDRLIPNFWDWGRSQRFFPVVWSLGMLRQNKNLHSSRNFFELIMASHGGFPPHPGLARKCRLSRQIECLELPSRSTQKSLIFVAETPQGKRNQSSVCSKNLKALWICYRWLRGIWWSHKLSMIHPWNLLNTYSLEKYTVRCLPHLITSSGCTSIPMLCLFHSRAMLNTPPTSKIMWIQPRIPCD